MRKTSRARMFAATAALACAGLASLAGSAQADELKFTFSDGRANLGSQQGVHIIDPAVPDTPATLTASYTPATDAFTAPASGLSFPSKTIENIPGPFGLTLDARADFTGLGAISGTYDQVTGVLDTTTLNVKATISVYPAGSAQTDGNLLTRCEISPVPLPFKTNGQIVDQNETPGNPADDIPYVAAPYVPGPGAVVATWMSLPASTNTGGTDFCGEVDSLVAGPGGIWLTGPAPTVGPNTCATVQALCPVTPPGGGTNGGGTAGVVVTPTAPKKCKKGQKLKKGKCVKKKRKKK